jgi:hypothetical protein
MNTKKIDNYGVYIDLNVISLRKFFAICLVNILNIQKAGYEADGDISDSTSLPSLNSDKDSKVNIYKSTIIVNFSFLFN